LAERAQPGGSWVPDLPREHAGPGSLDEAAHSFTTLGGAEEDGQREIAVDWLKDVSSGFCVEGACRDDTPHCLKSGAAWAAGREVGSESCGVRAYEGMSRDEADEGGEGRSFGAS
jgi:hypothetical protein